MILLETIKGFISEPCTLWFNRVWLGKWRDWSPCCENHDDGYSGYDLAYDRAAYRLMQDEELRDCVNKILPGMGSVMFVGVRTFGGLFVG